MKIIKSKILANRFLIPIVGLMLSPVLAQAQTPVKVNYNDGTAQFFPVESTGKMYFSNDNLMLSTDATSSPTTIPISLIRAITFEADNTTGLNDKESAATSISIYPNPANSYFTIADTKNQKLLLSIFDLNGKQLSAGNFISGDRVAINHLAAGLYIVKINNQQFKLIKQ